MIQKHKFHWSQRAFAISVVLGLLFLTISLIINYNAGVYATANASNAVTDILLDRLPVWDVDFVFIDGALFFILFMATLLAYKPQYIPFVLKSAALFIIIRSVFVMLTHIGPVTQTSPLIINNINKFFIFGGDLFFSGHTGLPYLMALIFWDQKILRGIFIFISIFAAATVLLGHLHYSIDVFAAFFITYAIFHIAERLFRRDYEYVLKA
ncbi:MAG: phosphatase PAP2-related protein [Patescibacteria group bacterium]